MLVNQFSETEPFVQFANQNQATVGGDVRSLEIDFQQVVELSWNGLVCFSPMGVGLPGVLIGI